MAHGKLYGRNMEPLLEYRSRLDTCCRLLLNAVYKWAVVVWARGTPRLAIDSVGNEGSRPSDFGRPPGKRIDKTIGTSGASSGVSR